MMSISKPPLQYLRHRCHLGAISTRPTTAHLCALRGSIGKWQLARRTSDDMAAYGGAEATAAIGNQIFVTITAGEEYPPKTCCVRVKYTQTVKDIRLGVQKQLGVPVENQQLFWQNRELLSQEDGKTLLEMSLHTGFSLRGYDLRQPPVYFPAVEKGPDGRLQMIQSNTA